MQLQAMNAFTATTAILESSNYIFEPKLDDFRALCYKHKNGKIVFMSRNNLDLTEKFFSDVLIDENIHSQSCVLDGEIVAYDASGVPSFSLLKTGSQAHFVVFDILMKNEKSLLKIPLIERKKILEKTVTDGSFIQKIPYTTHGKLLWQEVNRLKFEGVMAKEKESVYYPGRRSSVWLKIKLVNTLDCIIIGYSSGKRIIASLALGLYDDQGEIVYIGNVGTGFSEKILRDLEIKLLPLTTHNNVVNDQIKNIHWVKPKLVCEVKYQAITQRRKLRISVFLRLRDDKKPIECTVADQLFSVK